MIKFVFSFQGTIKVDMMCQEKNFPFVISPSLKCSAIEMPYQSEDLTMLVLLPDAKNGLDKLEKSLTFEELTDLRSKMRSQKVNIFQCLFKYFSCLYLFVNSFLYNFKMLILLPDAKAEVSTAIKTGQFVFVYPSTPTVLVQSA